jgi:hypothetical protein
MSIARPIDADDPLARAPDEVLAAFIFLGGHAARVRDFRMAAATLRKAAPANTVSQLAVDAAKLTLAAPRNAYLNRRV